MRKSLAVPGLLFGFLIGGLPLAIGGPEDPFHVAVPGRDTSPPQGVTAGGSQADVAESQGSATYSYPIAVPIGRNGMKPSLSLDYNSSGALRGGLAVGWTLDVPVIERDPDFPAHVRYRSTLGGGAKRLLKNNVEPGAGEHFRAEVDDHFARYSFEQTSTWGTWTVQTPDGLTRTFEGQDAAHGRQWRLTKERDFFGNEIKYVYGADALNLDGTIYVGHRLERIEWSANAAAGLTAHAKLELVYQAQEPCGGVPVGAQLEHRYGATTSPVIRGARRLTEIQVRVRDSAGAAYRLARKYALGYDGAELSCSGKSPLRFLTSISETGYDQQDAATSAPPVTFSYGPRRRELTSSVALGAIGHGDFGSSHGALGTRIDFDGDGLLDKLWVEDGPRCKLKWRKGLAGGQLTGPVRWMSLPSAAWRDSNQGSDYPSSAEHCTLGGQLSRRYPDSWGPASSPGCRDQGVTVSYQLLDYDQDGLPDLLVNMWEAPAGIAGGDFDPDNQLSGGFTKAALAPPGDGPRPCGSYEPLPEPGNKVRVFYNQGDGQLSGLGEGTVDMVWGPVTISMPYPLPPGGNEMTVETTPKPGLPTLTDINGDGHLDVISFTQNFGSNANPGLGSPILYVWPGPLGGNSTAQAWTMPPFLPFPQLNDPPSPLYHQTTSAMLQDMDGDGLVDIVAHSQADGQLVVLPNQLGSFGAPISLGYSGPLEKARVELVDYIGLILREGKRGFERRLHDVDADGLPELALYGTGSGGIGAAATSRTMAVLGRGGTLSGSWTASAPWDALRGTVVADDGEWYRKGDFADYTGDGQPDLVSWSGSGTATMTTDAPATTPLRLLERVDNGQGGAVRFEYQLSSAGAVTLAPGEHVAPRWLVTRVVRSAGFGQPDQRTGYGYAKPRHGKDSVYQPTPAGFRGFAEVTVSRSGQHHDSDSRVVKTYDFGLLGGRDGAPRVTTELHHASDGAGQERLERRLEHTYANVRLIYQDSQSSANGIPSFTYRTSTLERRYDGLGVEVGARRTTEVWNARVNATGARLLYTNDRSHDAEEGATLYRAQVRDFEVRFGQAPYAANDYRVLEILAEEQLGGGLPLTFARTVTVRDPATGLPLEERVHSSGWSYGRELRSFDAQTGNLLTVQRPTQVATGGSALTTYTYDTQKLTVAKTTNELGHAVSERFDLGSGALVRREGPDWRIYQVPGCTPGLGNWCLALVSSLETFKVDGLGRVREHWVSADPPAGATPNPGYVQRLLERIDYFDATPLVPRRRIHRTTRDFGGSAQIIGEDRHDGAGRLLAHIDRRQLPGRPDATTSYAYDARGDVARVDAPDPRVDTGATVATIYHRDGLGRVVGLYRPDGSSELTRYEGLRAVVQDGSAEGGPSQRTTLVHDVFGRLVQVIEHDNPAPGQDAPTSYAYDFVGRMTSITDADGNQTSMGYDWAGNRRHVNRDGRVWTYQYDVGGNLIAETSPLPTGAAAAEFTSSSTYDELDRLKTHTPATRGMLPERLAQLGIGTTNYAYDTNAAGQVVTVTLPFGRIDYSYDARGQVKREQRTIHFPGFTNTQAVDRASNALGAPTRAAWNGGTGWSYTYDARGLVDEVAIAPAGGAELKVAHYERSLGGAPRARGGGDLDQRREWSYDAVGRVIEDKVTRASNGHVYAWRTFGYDGAGELAATSGTVNGMDAGAVYEYDARGRLARAQGPLGYDATFAYSAAGNVNSAAVAGAADSPDRDVIYVYGARDNQAVDALEDATTGAALAQLGYDEAGNLVERSVDAGVLALAWDGDDQLREVSGPAGSEIYWFGPGGERIAALSAGGVKLWFGESETHFSPTGIQLLRWFHVAAGEPIARLGEGGGLELQYADTLQNLSLSIDAEGAVLAAFVYGAFGELVGALGGADHRRQFNGKENDEVSGLRHYGYRSYDPLLLRWISADPLYAFAPDAAWVEPQRANLYAFSLNNPLRYLDPDGRDPEEEKKKKLKEKKGEDVKTEEAEAEAEAPKVEKEQGEDEPVPGEQLRELGGVETLEGAVKRTRKALKAARKKEAEARTQLEEAGMGACIGDDDQACRDAKNVGDSRANHKILWDYLHARHKRRMAKYDYEGAKDERAKSKAPPAKKGTKIKIDWHNGGIRIRPACPGGWLHEC